MPFFFLRIFPGCIRVVLNKCDLLQAKLMRGAKIRDSVPSFGDRRNDVATATRCMSRPFFIFFLVSSSLARVPFASAGSLPFQ